LNKNAPKAGTDDADQLGRSKNAMTDENMNNAMIHVHIVDTMINNHSQSLSYYQ